MRVQDKQLLETHGCTVEKLENNNIRIIVPMDCPHLTKDCKCDLFGKPERPSECCRLDHDNKEGVYITDGCIL